MVTVKNSVEYVIFRGVKHVLLLALLLGTAGFYRPISWADKITCPALVLIAEKDSLIPATSVEKMAARIPRSETVHLPYGHFECYLGDPFEEIVEIEAEFLEKHLL